MTSGQRSLAHLIQQANYDTPDALFWKWCDCYAKILPDGKWIKAIFDHSLFNAKDAWKMIRQYKSDIIANNGKYVILPEQMWTEPIDRPPFDIYIGQVDIRPKEIIKFFFELNQSYPMYIPIDMSDVLGAPALLNYTFDATLSFEKNWEEVQRIKRNKDNYFLQEDRWKNHIQPQLRWVTMLRMEESEDVICPKQHNYDATHLQGLSIGQNKHSSHFVFSFAADPIMKDAFIQKYQLSLYY